MAILGSKFIHLNTLHPLNICWQNNVLSVQIGHSQGRTIHSHRWLDADVLYRVRRRHYNIGVVATDGGVDEGDGVVGSDREGCGNPLTAMQQSRTRRSTTSSFSYDCLTISTLPHEGLHI